MAGKFTTASLETEVLNDLRNLSFKLSLAENARVSLSDTVRVLMQEYLSMHTEFANGASETGLMVK